MKRFAINVWIAVRAVARLAARNTFVTFMVGVMALAVLCIARGNAYRAEHPDDDVSVPERPVDPARFEKAMSLYADMRARGILREVHWPAGSRAGFATVGEGFFLLTFRDKETACMVAAALPDSARSLSPIGLVDEMTGKDVGTYQPLLGLTLK